MTSILPWRCPHRLLAGVVLACCLPAAGCVQLPDFGAMWAKVPTPKNLANAEKQKFTLARLAERRGQTEDARQIYEAVLAKNPNHQQAHHRLGVYYARQRQYHQADAHFHKAWELGPQSADLLSDMGYRLHLEDRLPEAEKLLREALAKEPQHVAATNNLALVVGQQGRLQEALALFKQVGGEAEAEANLAYLLAQRGDLRLAQAHYSKALSIKSDMKPAAAALLQIANRETLDRTGQPLLEPLQSPARYAPPRMESAAAESQVAGFLPADGQASGPAPIQPTLAANPYNLPLPERPLGPAGPPPGIPQFDPPGSAGGQAVLAGYAAPAPGSRAVPQVAPALYPPAAGAPPTSFGTQGTPGNAPSPPPAARITGVQPLAR